MSTIHSESDVRFAYSDGLAVWLQSQGLAIAFSTYQTNRLFCLGLSDTGSIVAHEQLLDKPMGLFARGQNLYVSSRHQIWQYEDLLEPNETHQGCDRLYLPKHSHTTGDLNVHDVVLDSNGTLLFVNTDFSCLARLSDRHSFEPFWQPPFISKLAAEDRCHLNGLALKDGQPAYVTACSSTDGHASWRGHRRDGGVVIDIASGACMTRGLSMPHSPRWYQDRLWLLNSGSGEFGWIDPASGTFEPLCFCPGFVRGLAFCGNQAIVGLSKLRSRSFSGLALEERLAATGQESQCGLMVIDLSSGQVEQWLRFETVVEELFDVVLLPGVRQPQLIGFQSEEIERLINFPGSGGLVVTKPTVMRPRLGAELSAEAAPAMGPLKYQRVFQLTPETLIPYDPFTFPSLRQRWASQPQRGELLGTSASVEGAMVAFAIAECLPDRTAELISLFVAPPHRRRGVARRLLAELELLVRQEGCNQLIRPLPSPDVRALFAKARALQDEGNTAEAMLAYQTVLELDPSLAVAHCNLGVIHQLAGNPDKAMDAYLAAIAAKPSFALAHLNLGRLHLSQQRLHEAESCLRHVVDLQPNAAIAHLELANVQRLLGHTDAAIAGCHRALDCNPELPDAWYTLGTLWMIQEDMPRARHCFEQVLQRQSDHLAARQNLDQVLESIAEIDAAPPVTPHSVD